ncbi:hypothetical protein NSZ01_26400 [Nocardioides szechwanensis]|uniref:Ig-like domain (Group 1) n=1 Tax=Nocardioides szechwanensis TaxID=1005944 RepID=A0A1H0AFA6_9ACTN|nr:Ig-like domain-containing protein [Nocardioides szechwanensis]GEP34872.1 hypothetical protein NSZ01_26400 [Nocardioides szechwanensis]SDN32219.1 Ig-like domain (group 1) [Nocardioides szechwanensis]
MNSSGIKRGLATTAITALAVTGIPFLATSANAVPLDSSVPTATSVIVVAPDTAIASTKNDGQNTTIRLEALGGTSVAQVRFEYSIGVGTYNPIATVSRNDNGAFSTEWAAAGLNGATVNIRAVGITAGGVDGTTTTPDVVAINSTSDTVNVNDGASIAVFQKPDYDGAGADVAAQNVAVSGTSSSTTGAPSLAFWDPSAAAYVTGGTATSTTTGTPAPPTGTWSGVLDITGYDYGTNDELLVKATQTTDDAEAFALVKQVITTVTAVADRTNVPAGETATVVVTVRDQNGTPVVGAEVRDSDGNLIGQTNSLGQVTTTQGPGAEYYYANATASDPYEANLGDKQSQTITVTGFNAVPTTLAGTSTDGAAFDFDEYVSGDIFVQVKNQNGGNLDVDDSQDLEYYWVVTPFDGSAQVRYPTAPAVSTQTTDAGGKFVVDLPAAPRISGTYELFAALDADTLGNGAIASSKVLTVKAGEATVTYDETSPESAPAGTDEVVDGQVVLEDKTTGLPGRSVVLTYQQGTTGSDPVKDANFVPATGVVLTSTRTVTTGADGSFKVTVDDPADTPQGTELGGNVDAVVTGIGASGIVNDQGVDFVSATAPAGSTVVITPITAVVSPGEAQSGTATVTQPDGADLGTDRDPVAGQLVTLTVDKGFFTSGAEETPSVVGADAGNLVNLGTSITAVTNAAGEVTFKTAIERDAGFDDDGLVTSIVTATAGTGVSDTEDVDYTSATPLNGGTVEIALSPASEQDGPTDPAMVGDRVFYDVFVTDQFGNLVGGESVAITDNEEDVTVVTSPVVSDFDDNGDFYVTASQAASATITGTWSSDSYEYTTTTGTALPSTDEPRTGTADVEFYESVVTTTTIESTPEGEVPVGTAVTETVTVLDQEGNPIPNVAVEFIRNGPGAGDGDANVERTTNAQGKAFYTFIGTQAGVANITATVTSNDGIETLNDSVVFVADEPVGPVAIVAKLSGNDNGAANDKLKVNAPSIAQGAEVRLFKVIDGRRIQVGKTKGLNQFGNAVFIVRDRNGGRLTKYVAVVVKTAKTLGDTTNPKRVR